MNIGNASVNRIRLGQRFVILFSLLFLLILLAPTPTKSLFAQGKTTKKEKEKKKEEETIESFNLELNREASSKMEAIRSYLKPGIKTPWDTLIEAAQKLLEEPKDSFIEVEQFDSKSGRIKKNKVSLKTEVNRLIGSFDKTGRDMYQLMYGPRADAKLKQAIEQGNRDMLAEVSETYLHTKAGTEAVIRLGSWHLDRGRYIQAALTFQKLLLRNEEDKLDPSIYFKAALAFKKLGDGNTSKEYWNRLTNAMGNKNELKIEGRTFTLDQLQKYYDQTKVATAILMNEKEWLVSPGGNLLRNARGIGGRPFMEPRFINRLLPPFEKDKEPPSISDFRDKDLETPAGTWNYIDSLIKESYRQFENRPILPLSMFFPVASKGKVVYRSYDGLYCVATKQETIESEQFQPGELIWFHKAQNNLYDMVSSKPDKTNFDSKFRMSYRNHGPYGIYFENSLIGSLTQDGENVYYVDDMAVPPHPNDVNNGNGLNNPWGGIQQQVWTKKQKNQIYHNQLRAVSLETGLEVWNLGSRDDLKTEEKENLEEPDAYLSDVFFLGPPLPLGGKLYVMIEKQRELQLICLDWNRKSKSKTQNQLTPSISWAQPLGSPMAPLPGDTLRRVQGVHLAYSEGIIICPTNSGAVLGIDLLSHSLVWAHSYREASAANGGNEPRLGRINRFNPGMVNNAFQMNQDRWRLGTPFISQGKVVIAPYDSGTVECLDLRTGETLWKSSRAASDLYVAGIFDDKVMVVGKNSVRFLNLNSPNFYGQQIGKEIAIGVPSGIGTASDQIYFLPIKSAPDSHEPEIWSIDLKKGIVVAKTRSRKKLVPGNLLFFDGELLSQNEEQFVAFPQLQVKMEDMNRLLQSNPKDPSGLAEKADLLLDDGKLMQAIDTLHLAMQNKPSPEIEFRAREKLYEAITELMQIDFNQAEPFLAEYRGLCQFKPLNTKKWTAKMIEEEQLKRESNRLLLVAKGREKQGKALDAFENYYQFGVITQDKELVSVLDEPNTSARPDIWAHGRIDHLIAISSPEQKKSIENRIMEEWSQIRTGNDLSRLRRFVRMFGGFFEVGTESQLLLANLLVQTLNENDLREAEGILLTLRKNANPLFAAQATFDLAKLFSHKSLMDDAVKLYQELELKYPNQRLQDGRTGVEVVSELLTDKRFHYYLEPLQDFWPNKLQANEEQGGVPNQQQGTVTLDAIDDNILPYFQRHRVQMLSNFNGSGLQGIRVVDLVTNEEKFQYGQLPMAFNANLGIHTSQHGKMLGLAGHIMIIPIRNEVFAFDPIDKKLLWRYNLFGKFGSTLGGNVEPNQFQVDGNGDLVAYYQDGWSMRVGQIGLVTSSLVVLATRDGLVALNPADGKVLWIRHDVSTRVRLTGDESTVFIIENNPDGSPCRTRAIRGSDGVSISNIPDSSGYFSNNTSSKFFGHFLFVLEDNKKNKIARLHDMKSGKDIWSKELDPKAIVLKADNVKRFGYVSSKGEIVIFQAETGEELSRLQIDADKVAEHLKEVNEAILLEDNNSYYIILNRPEKNGNTYPSFIATMRYCTANGSMYCFNKNSKKRLWYTNKQLENQLILLDQFKDIPVLIAASNFNQVVGGAFMGQFTNVAILDKQSGKYLAKKSLQSAGQFTALVNNPKDQIITFWRHDIRFKLTPKKPQENPKEQTTNKTTGAVNPKGGQPLPPVPK